MRRLLASAFCVLMLASLFAGCKKNKSDKTDKTGASYSSLEKSDIKGSDSSKSDENSSQVSEIKKGSDIKIGADKNSGSKANSSDKTGGGASSALPSSSVSSDTGDKNTDLITDNTDGYVDGVW